MSKSARQPSSQSTILNFSFHQYIRYLKGIITEPVGPTLGVEYQTKSIILKDGTVVKVQIWDTCKSQFFELYVKDIYSWFREI